MKLSLNDVKIVIKNKSELRNLKGLTSITHCKGHNTALICFDFVGFRIQHSFVSQCLICLKNLDFNFQ